MRRWFAGKIPTYRVPRLTSDFVEQLFAWFDDLAWKTKAAGKKELRLTPWKKLGKEHPEMKGVNGSVAAILNTVLNLGIDVARSEFRRRFDGGI